jgi:hypothetical protein
MVEQNTLTSCLHIRDCTAGQSSLTSKLLLAQSALGTPCAEFRRESIVDGLFHLSP